jgi:hypothetical protein
MSHATVDAAYADDILVTSWDQFKKMGKEFIDAMKDVDLDGLENGRKMIGIAYLELKDLTPGEEIQAPILLNILMRASLKREFELTLYVKI